MDPKAEEELDKVLKREIVHNYFFLIFFCISKIRQSVRTRVMSGSPKTRA